MQTLIDGPPTLDAKDILFDVSKDRLGSGSYGNVYKGVVMGLPVAIKVPNKQHLTPEEKEDFHREISVMKKVFHPNIVLFLGASTEGKIMIVSELMKCDLETLLYSPEKLPDSLKVELTSELKLKLCTDMALSINWLHNVVGLVHRDLKPENFMIDEHMNVKVTDFGFTVFPSEVKKEEGWRGTPYYLSKEVMLNNDVTFACDVYALGLIMWQTFTQQPIFPEYDDFDEYANDVICGTKRPIINDSVPKLFVPTMQKMWDSDYKKRPKCQEVVEIIQQVSLENALTDSEGLAFWKKHFYNQKTGGLQLDVEKAKFIKELCKELKTSIDDEHPVHELFETKVTPTSFQKMIDLFGKFFKHTTIFKEICDFCEEEWFAFEITREVAQGWLDRRADGNFIVRFSPKTPEYPFVISYLHKKELKHNRVVRVTTKNVPVRYKTKNIINQKDIQARTLGEIVQMCKDEGLISVACPHEKIAADTYD